MNVDQFAQATTEMVVITKSRTRYFDLDAVRTPHITDDAITRPRVRGLKDDGYGGRASSDTGGNPAGAPPLDWWQPKPNPITPPPERTAMGAARYIVGDVFDVLATLEPASVDLVLTSPPFLALRSYLPADHPDKQKEIGSEPTPGQFIDTLLDVVEACARVLAPHGSMCIELGDTYSGSGGAGGDYNTAGLREGQEKFDGSARRNRPAAGIPGVMSPGGTMGNGNGQTRKGDGWPQDKSLCLIPELFRISLVYGFNPLTGRTTPPWRARNVIRWVRPNPPVGALGDKFRPATTEMVVLTHSRTRYFDLDAVRTTPQAQGDCYTNGPKSKQREAEGIDGIGRYAERLNSNPAGAPPLDWWKISTQPFSGSHFATWPTALCVIPIKSMCPAFVCLDCGTALGSVRATGDVLRGMRNGDSGSLGEDAGRTSQAAVLLQDVRQSSHSKEPGQHQGLDSRPEGLHLDLGSGSSDGKPGRLCDGTPARYGEETKSDVDGGGRSPSSQWDQGRQPAGESGPVDEGSARQVPEDEETHRVPVLRARRSVDGEGTCCGSCGSTNLRVGRTLDPFAGSGTTLAVATGHGRDAIGIDLDPSNAQLAVDRVGPLLLTIEHHQKADR